MIVAKTTSGQRQIDLRRDRGSPAHSRGGFQGLHRARFCRDQHARDRDACPGFEGNTLRAGRQQAGNARGLHRRARQTTCRCPRKNCPSRAIAEKSPPAHADRLRNASCCARSASPPLLPYSDWPLPRRYGRPRSRGAVDSLGGEAGRAALRAIMTHAHSSGLLSGQPIQMAEQFAGLLWGNLMVGLCSGSPSGRSAARSRDGPRRRGGLPAALSTAAPGRWRIDERVERR